jgi:hypothetical protein
MLLNMIALATAHDENYKKEARARSQRNALPPQACPLRRFSDARVAIPQRSWPRCMRSTRLPQRRF